MNANLRLQDLYGREKEGETKLLALYVPKELTNRIIDIGDSLRSERSSRPPERRTGSLSPLAGGAQESLTSLSRRVMVTTVPLAGEHSRHVFLRHPRLLTDVLLTKSQRFQ